MSEPVGILLLTHQPLAGALTQVARSVLGELPPTFAPLEFVNDTARETMQAEVLRQLDRLDQGAGVLILTDLYGATPSNLAIALLERRPALRVVTGVNLPMLLRALNYRMLDLAALADRALNGGREGVRPGLSPETDP